MAVIKLGSTKSMNKLLSYCENKAEVQSGINVDDENAKTQMKATRMMFDKDNGRQGYHLIQSFDPDDKITPQKANEIGQELAKQVAPGHEVTVYTHTDRDHVHNHICINSVNMDTGLKYVNDRQNLYDIRRENDKLCKEQGLSIADDKTAENRYTLTEKSLLEKGQSSWKDAIRQAVDITKKISNSIEDFKDKLQSEFGIEVKERGKNISFKHPEKKVFVRGKTLGNAYEKGTIENELARKGKQLSEQQSKRNDRGNERPRGTNQNTKERANVTRFERITRNGRDRAESRTDTQKDFSHTKQGQDRKRDLHRAYAKYHERTKNLNGESSRDNQSANREESRDLGDEVKFNGPELSVFDEHDGPEL